MGVGEWFITLCRMTYVNEPQAAHSRYVLTPSVVDAAGPIDAKVTDEALVALIALGWTPPKEAPDGGE